MIKESEQKTEALSSVIVNWKANWKAIFADKKTKNRKNKKKIEIFSNNFSNIFPQTFEVFDS